MIQFTDASSFLEHQWLHFIDTIQYDGNEKNMTIGKNDIVVGVQEKSEITVDVLEEDQRDMQNFIPETTVRKAESTPADEEMVVRGTYHSGNTNGSCKGGDVRQCCDV